MEDYRLRQCEYLLSISRAMTSKLDLSSLLQLIIESSVEILRGQAGLIALRDRNGQFRVAASYGLPYHAIPLFSPLLIDIPSYPSLSSGGRWHIPNLRYRLELATTAAGIGLRQVVALPLSIEDELIGVIYVFRAFDTAFSTNDRKVLASFADQAAIAVRNASLYQAVDEERRRLDAILRHSADGIMILDSQRRIETMNHALARMTGWLPEEAIGQPCQRVLALRNRQGVDLCASQCPLRDVYGRETLHVEGEIVRPEGVTTSVSITYTPLFDASGELVNIIGNVQDITRFREAEEMKSTFISAISHELKTPVALIKGYAGTLRREDAQWDTATLREGLSIIEEEAEHLDHLINNLLDASRIQAGTLKLQLSEVNLSQIAAKVVERFQTQTKIHQIYLNFPSDYPFVLADEERMREVFGNLLSNAIKYSPDGGDIIVGGWADKNWVYAYVADQGVGISAKEQARLFEPFYRVDSVTTRRTHGVGLGLFLVRAIVEGHGGRVWVESTPGKGSTFTFMLPRKGTETG
ncbi:MAG: PAS domain S-box protein [Chloroflexi bacterium]|nr:PAS domain S-box protein [Chloroflexota bacterium]